ncbi:MAG: hypothetical protein EPN91_05910, partial [Salinibacterium sp.]
MAVPHRRGGHFCHVWLQVGRSPKPGSLGLTRCVAGCAPCYTLKVIKSFRHKGLRLLFETGSAAGVQPNHAKRLRIQFAVLDSARTIDDIKIPVFRLHPLKGGMDGRWSITVDGNWRVTFEFRDGNAYVLDYED